MKCKFYLKYFLHIISPVIEAARGWVSIDPIFCLGAGEGQVGDLRANKESNRSLIRTVSFPKNLNVA
jgi:hypothetical protein